MPPETAEWVSLGCKPLSSPTRDGSKEFPLTWPLYTTHPPQEVKLPWTFKMGELQVTSIQVPSLLDKLRNNEWLVPEFQRDFVWSSADVTQLVLSIIDSRPIGMATLWEQEGNDQIPLEPISLPDWDNQDRKKILKHFSEKDKRPNQFYAILDGRQRCTAIAMAFGGFRPNTGRFPKFYGRYFLNVCAEDPTKRIVFKKESEIKKQELDRDSTCVGKGLFPLASNKSGEPILQQWMRYLQEIKKPENYPNGNLPEETEVEKRNQLLQSAFQGIVDTKLAVYSVPAQYDLGEICEIFETLNTTGTRVSTIDLIHSWLYSETQQDIDGPFLLREWIDNLGEYNGAVGWASSEGRPELIAQMCTACYIVLDQKSQPRPVSGSNTRKIQTIKAGDLLATPKTHWKNIIAETEQLARFLGEFQTCVADGGFPQSLCPYPITAGLYVALRWKLYAEPREAEGWGVPELDALFKAFFWRNALTNRYDQGFLTQVGTDIRRLLEILESRPKFASAAAWAGMASSALQEIINYSLPCCEDLEEALTDGRPGGAFQRALMLPMYSGVRQDFVNPDIDLSYPHAETRQLHHIFPKQWCRGNAYEEMKDVLDKNRAGRDYIDSIANLIPMDRTSNKQWKEYAPRRFFEEKGLSFAPLRDRLEPLFIDKTGFDLLMQGARGLPQFWQHRARLMAEDVLRRTEVTI